MWHSNVSAINKFKAEYHKLVSAFESDMGEVYIKGAIMGFLGTITALFIGHHLGIVNL